MVGNDVADDGKSVEVVLGFLLTAVLAEECRVLLDMLCLGVQSRC